MKTNILKEFSLQATDFSGISKYTDVAFVNEYFGMARSVAPFFYNYIKEGQPYRFVEGRVLWVNEGSADFELTLEEYHVEKGDIMLFAPETIMELKGHSDDYNMMGIMYKSNILANTNIIVRPRQNEWEETLGLANILWNIATRKPFSRETVGYLLNAIISDIKDISDAAQALNPGAKKSRQEQIFISFKKMVNEHCCQHRNIPFYAERLALTPHYLSSVISNVSGKSVMYWINRATLVYAKVLLNDKDTPIYEVAERLNFPNQSAFGIFFKRETGMTPGEYRRIE